MLSQTSTYDVMPASAVFAALRPSSVWVRASALACCPVRMSLAIVPMACLELVNPSCAVCAAVAAAGSLVLKQLDGSRDA